jgi:hypothetical protein
MERILEYLYEISAKIFGTKSIKGKDWEELNYLVQLPDSTGYVTFPALPFNKINMEDMRHIKKESDNNDNFKFSGHMLLPLTIFAVSQKENTKDTFEGFVEETYEEYISKEQFRKDRQQGKDSWIYSIIDGEKETEAIKQQDEDIMIMNGWNWNGENAEETLRLLILFKDKSLDTLRDLTGKHILVLRKAKETIAKYISDEYPTVNTNRLRYYFHYSPSTYQLHLHVLVLSRLNTNPDMAYCHMLETVINNLEVFPDYYKKIKMIKRE